ncbi:VaFE repeat-containing surface-anchored protein, partial [Corynebacterium minutissimum]
MSRLRNISREGWMVFTAVLTAIAVIAAMVAIPGVRAEAAEPTDFVPNTTLGNEQKKEETNPQHFAADYSWGLLVWAGKPAGPGFNNGGYKGNDVGWAWCIEPHAKTPLNTWEKYEQKKATKLKFDKTYHDAVINLARKMESAAARGDSKSAANYYVYLLMFLNSSRNPKSWPAGAIKENDKKAFPAFTGSHEEFTALTGYKIEGSVDVPKLVKDPSVQIAKQPADAYITVVHPNNNPNSSAQSVIPVDQPGLPDDDGENPGTEETPKPSEPSTTEEQTTEETPSETIDESTTDESDEPSTTPNTDVVPEPTPSSSDRPEPREPKVSTNADFANGATEVVAGAKVNDTVTYEGLVPGKEYTLKAELISKADGKTVLGEGEKTFTPEAANGEVVVEITVDESVTEPVEAAVAFEELTSVEVNKDGEETPDATSEKPNHIAEHKDINDKAQTVNSKVEPKVSTNADFANGATEVVAGAKVNDTVTYEGLVPGKEYTLKA